jgi:hypothetical protein
MRTTLSRNEDFHAKEIAELSLVLLRETPNIGAGRRFALKSSDAINRKTNFNNNI